MDKYGVILDSFLSQIALDPRISATHISLYVALLHQWSENGFIGPVVIKREKVMQLAKISSPRTYFKRIKNLDEFGYISYWPANHRFMKSTVQINFNLRT